MKKLFIRQYTLSESIKLLKESLRSEGIFCKTIKNRGSRYRYNPTDHLVLNYGCSAPIDHPVLNKPEAIHLASNKLLTFKHLRDSGYENLPIFSENIEDAREWISNGKIVYCRTILTGSQGHGIVVARTEDELVRAPLYVQKVPRTKEVRVHVFMEQVIDFSEKRRRQDSEVENDVRNLQNGWVFCRENVEIPDDAKDAAIKAVSLLGLDFGAVDMALNRGIPRIFEVNTAPGMTGTTLENYKNAIKNLL